MKTLNRFVEKASDALIVHCAIGYLTYECLLDPIERVAAKICDKWALSHEEFDSLCIRSWPNERTNVIACHALYERLGERIAIVPGLFQSAGCWRLDLDADRKYVDTGFVMPIRNRSTGWFCELRAFRSVSDDRGFLVKVRANAA